MAAEKTVKTAAELTEALDRMSAALEAANRYGRRNRQIIVADLVISVVLAAVTFISIHAAISAAHANTRANSAYASNQALCQAGNVGRRQNEALWVFFLDILGKPRTAAAAHVEGLLRAKLVVTYAPRQCSTLGQHR